MIDGIQNRPSYFYQKDIITIINYITQYYCNHILTVY